MKLGRLEIYWIEKDIFSAKEKEELGIIHLPKNLLKAYKTINRYSEKMGENHNYLLANMIIPNINRLPDTFKEEKQKEKEERKRKMEEAQKQARDFKDYQRRDQLGLLTPEEIEHKRLKKEEKKEKWLNKRTR